MALISAMVRVHASRERRSGLFRKEQAIHRIFEIAVWVHIPIIQIR
jgi:hypothetical protein